MLLELSLYIYPGACVQQLPSLHALEGERVGCRVYKSLALLNGIKTFSKPENFTTCQQYIKVSIDLSLRQHLSCWIFNFYQFSANVKPSIFWICISWITKVGHLIICLLYILNSLSSSIFFSMGSPFGRPVPRRQSGTVFKRWQDWDPWSLGKKIPGRGDTWVKAKGQHMSEQTPLGRQWEIRQGMGLDQKYVKGPKLENILREHGEPLKASEQGSDHVAVHPSLTLWVGTLEAGRTRGEWREGGLPWQGWGPEEEAVGPPQAFRRSPTEGRHPENLAFRASLAPFNSPWCILPFPWRIRSG